MPAEVLSHLRDMASVAAAEADGGMRSRDAGMEYASAWVGDAEVQAEWSPVLTSPERPGVLLKTDQRHALRMQHETIGLSGQAYPARSHR